MLPALDISGTDIVEKDSRKVVHLVGLTEFALFKRYTMDNGPSALVEPILLERRKAALSGGWAGPIFLRVFRHAANWNPFYLEPWSYKRELLTEFCNFCGDRGFYIDLRAGAFQEVLPQKDGQFGQQEHVNQVMNALVGTTNCIFQLSNEPFKNGCLLDPNDVPKWGTTLRDSGYYNEIQEWDTNQNLELISYHSPRGGGGYTPPKWLFDMNDQLAVLKTAFGKPVKLEEPIGFQKEQIEGKRFNNPAYAKEMGELADDGGIYLHSQIGLSSDGYDMETQEAAEAFWSGVSGVLNK